MRILTLSFALAVTALLATCGALAAADLALAPLYRVPVAQPGWGGFYLGVNGGGGIGDGRSDFGVASGPVFASVDNWLAGGVGGVQAGYNWQAGVVVFGAETDIQASSLNGTLSAPCLPGLCGLPLSASFSQKTPWFGTVRGRFGGAANGWLIYATAGYAYARLETEATATAGTTSASASLQETRGGWTAGGGIEVALAPNWSAKLEYLYLDLGRTNSTWALGSGLPAITDDARFIMNIVRAGVNYRF
jgi:opacity protein-like surface antigen